MLAVYFDWQVPLLSITARSQVSYSVICTFVVMFSLFSTAYYCLVYFEVFLEMNKNVLSLVGRKNFCSQYFIKIRPSLLELHCSQIDRQTNDSHNITLPTCGGRSV